MVLCCRCCCINDGVDVDVVGVDVDVVGVDVDVVGVEW